MQSDEKIILRSSTGTRIFASIMALALAAAFVAAAVGFLRERSSDSGELWSLVGIEIFLLGLFVLCLTGIFRRAVLEPDAISIIGLFGKKTYRAADLGGFCRLTIVVNGIPVPKMLLYNQELKGRQTLPMNFKNAVAIERWLMERVPEVSEKGSALRSKVERI